MTLDHRIGHATRVLDTFAPGVEADEVVRILAAALAVTAFQTTDPTAALNLGINTATLSLKQLRRALADQRVEDAFAQSNRS